MQTNQTNTDEHLYVQEVEDTFNGQLSTLDRHLKSNNKGAIHSIIDVLFITVNENPFLYPKFLKKMFSIDASYRKGVNPYDLHYTMPDVGEWLKKMNLNIFELMPVKEYILPKYIPFDSTPDDKNFMSMHAKFNTAGNKLYSKMLGTHFNEEGIVTTDGTKLLFTTYRNKTRTLHGIYSYSENTFVEDGAQKADFPAWKNAIPLNNTHKIFINSREVLNYLNNTIQLGLLDKNNNAVAFYYPNKEQKIAFDAYYLLTCIDTLMRLGHNELEISFNTQGSGALIYPKGRSAVVERRRIDFVLLMPRMLSDDEEEMISTYDFDTNCVVFADNSKDYSFDTIAANSRKAETRLKEIEAQLINTQQELFKAREEVNAEQLFTEVEGVKEGEVYLSSNYGQVKVLHIRQNKTDSSRKIPFIVRFDRLDKKTNEFTGENIEECSLSGFKTSLIDTKNTIIVDNAFKFINVLAS